MLEQIHQVLLHYATFTGGINVQLSLNSSTENPEHLKELFGLVKEQLETKTFDEQKAGEYQEKFYNLANEQRNGEPSPKKEEDVQDDDTLDDKYYIINYDEEPFIPQQHYFNSFYMVEQVMYDQEEAEQALQQEPENQQEMEYETGAQYAGEQEEQEAEEEEEGYEYDPRYDQGQYQ